MSRVPEPELADQPDDALVPNREHPIRLPVFEGPLDLLLFLIRRNEIDIRDIPIETVTRQYLGVLRQMEAMNLEVAGEFFVMAATLMYIKSRMLLPTDEQISQPEEDEEEADPRWELVRQLMEYKRFKEAALDLADLIAERQDYLPRFCQVLAEDLESRELRPTDRIELWNTFNQVLRRLSERLRPGEIHDDHVTVADRMEVVLAVLERAPQFTFESLFDEGPFNLNVVVATFLAILELTRLKKMALEQTEDFGDILCRRWEGEGAAEDPAT